MGVILDAINSWAAAEGAAKFKMSESLLWLQDASAPAAVAPDPSASGSSTDVPVPRPARDFIVAAIDARFQPVAQLYAPCHVLGSEAFAGSMPRICMPSHFPFTVEICVAQPRMDWLTKRSRSVSIVTSAELALAMAKLSSKWRMFPLVWRLPKDTDSLLQMEMVGHGEEFVPRPKRQVRMHVWHPELDGANHFQADPMDVGGAGGGHPPPLDGAGLVDRGAGVGLEDSDDSDLEDIFQLGRADVESMGEAPLDVAPDLDVAFDAGGVAPGSPGALGGVEDGAVGAALSGPEDDRAEELLADDGLEPEPPLPAPMAPSVEELVANSAISPYGNVTCTLAPYSSMARVGRLTTWPVERPLHLRSASMQCSLHTGSGVTCSLARARATVSDATLLKWLYMGEFLPAGASKDERRRLAVAHKALFPSA